MLTGEKSGRKSWVEVLAFRNSSEKTHELLLLTKGFSMRMLVGLPDLEVVTFKMTQQLKALICVRFYIDNLETLFTYLSLEFVSFVQEEQQDRSDEK